MIEGGTLSRYEIKTSSFCSLLGENREARNRYSPTNVALISSAAEPTGTGMELLMKRKSVI